MIEVFKEIGFEIGDAYSFFNFRDRKGLRSGFYERKFRNNSKELDCEGEVYLSNGSNLIDYSFSYRLKDFDKLLEVNSKFMHKTSGLMMDYVIRFRIEKSMINHIRIGQDNLYHNAKNIYYTRLVDEVILSLTNGKELKLSGGYDSSFPGLRSTFYARDAKDEWIVHFRLLPDQRDVRNNLVLKSCTSWTKTYTFPFWISNSLLNLTWFKKLTLYRSEVRPYKSILNRILLNLSSYYVNKVECDYLVNMCVKVKVC